MFGLVNAASDGRLNDVKEHIDHDVNASGRAGVSLLTAI